MSIQKHLQEILSALPEGVRLVAVSKTREADQIMEAYLAGHRDFGESKAQEMVPKYEALPKDIRWHMVGHLQRNKVKQIAPFVHLIHSVDSPRLLKEIHKQGEKHQRRIDCLLQIHIAEESTKFGMDQQELVDLLESDLYRQMKFIRICGLMGMATFTEDSQKVRGEFRHLREQFQLVKEKYFSSDDAFCELSMGMSDDYLLGIEEGSTMVRVGSAIFGQRS